MQRILLVDDDRMTLEFMKLFLESESFSVHIAENAYDAYTLFEEVKPQIILTDIELGNDCGLALAQRFRDSGASKIIGITGHSMDFFDKDNSVKLFDSILLKPIDFKQLLLVISNNG